MDFRHIGKPVRRPQMKRALLLTLMVIVAFSLGWLANDAFTFSKAMRNDRFADYRLKPKNVPAGAFWAGGVDGGNWFVVKQINNLRNEASIEVYNDQDGSLLLSKSFILTCPTDNQILIDSLKEQINFFDGTKIFLTSDLKRSPCYLQ